MLHGEHKCLVLGYNSFAFIHFSLFYFALVERGKFGGNWLEAIGAVEGKTWVGGLEQWKKQIMFWTKKGRCTFF